MVLRLVGDLPMLWRTPTSVQFGSDVPVVVLDEVAEGEDRLLAALAAGVSESGFTMLAESAGVEAGRAAELLATLAPVLVGQQAPSRGRAGVLGDSTLARSIAGLLSASDALTAPDDATLVVLVADWVLAPADHLHWLNRDVPHLPVVVTERSVTVGPFVEPGDGPCLYCVHLARTDADPAWPAIATQLLGRAPRELGGLDRAAAAVAAARRALARLDGATHPGMSWQLRDGGDVSVRVWSRHPDCRCAVPEGTDWAAAPDRADRAAPTTASAVAARA
jgi:hypothetical protein